MTVGAVGEGMVAGDLVNTASRVQSIAEPGTVLVDEPTRRSTEAGVAYVDIGTHELRGKDEAVALWHALRVTAARGGELKSDALEPPFVGRDGELRLLKELFHGSADERKSRLVKVVGVAGIGKSRLAWELYKYVDGLAQIVAWHMGRCLAYGEGVTYWALGEMVRMRCRIAETEGATEARTKLTSTLELYVDDKSDRDWLEPRLAHLLGLERLAAPDQADLFGAWRLFFERIAAQHPVVLVFEDMQWADAALLSFVEHLLEWSRGHPILVLALARSEFTQRRPEWPEGRVDVATIALEPLSESAMQDLVDGAVPGLPTELRDRIVAHAEGVPLHAVETVRMLLDRELLERDGDAYRPTTTIEALEVPETLHALLAARLDGLTSDERRLVQVAAVLGKTFTTAALQQLTGIAGEQLDSLLTALTRKEVLFLQRDPRSPERGQYGFLQDLLRQVAYETLSRKERKARHLAVASWLEEQSAGEVELVEVVAAHYVAAHESDPQAADAEGTRAHARALLVRAGEHAASLAAPVEAQRYFERALELADDARARAELHERAGRMALIGSRAAEARSHLERSIEHFEKLGLTHAAARVSVALATLTAWQERRMEQAIADLEIAYDRLADSERDDDFAILAAQLGRLLFLSGRRHDGLAPIEVALEIAEARRLPEVLSDALNTKGLILHALGRIEEARALLERALVLATEHDLHSAASRAHLNLGFFAACDNRHSEALERDRICLELARRIGDRNQELGFRHEIVADLTLLGEWDEALSLAEELASTEPDGWLRALPVLVYRGDLAEARRQLDSFAANVDHGNAQAVALLRDLEAIVLLAEGDAARALTSAREAMAAVQQRHPTFQSTVWHAFEAAFDVGDAFAVDELLTLIDSMARGVRTRRLDGTRAHFAARRAAERGEADVAAAAFDAAAKMFRELEMPLQLGLTLLAHAEWLDSEGRSDAAAPLFDEAAQIFERLRATPWVERARRRAQSVAAAAST